MTKYLTAVIVLWLAAPTAVAQEKEYVLDTATNTVTVRDVEKIKTDVADLRKEAADLKARQDRLEAAWESLRRLSPDKATDAPVPAKSVSPKDGCPLDCPCAKAAASPTTVKTTVKAATAPGHTHTCANGHTWDHSMDGGSHRCPICGLMQWVQDASPSPTVQYQPAAGYFVGGGCANGACATSFAPQRTGWYLGKRLGR